MGISTKQRCQRIFREIAKNPKEYSVDQEGSITATELRNAIKEAVGTNRVETIHKYTKAFREFGFIEHKEGRIVIPKLADRFSRELIEEIKKERKKIDESWLK